jgi:hypothetical protein
VIACAHCGTAMPTPTGRASRKRYCNVECRKAAWRERHRNDTESNHVVPDVLAVTTAFPDDVPNHGGQHHCPHCRQPLAIISVVIPADAATVRPPEAPLTGHNSANLNPSPGEDDLATLGNFGERQHGPLIGSDHPVRIHPKRRCAAATLAKPAGDRSNVYAGSDQFGG